MNESRAPVDLRLPVVGGIIGQGVRFERIRRITGYLVGTMNRFNNAKRAEVADRVKHTAVIKADGYGSAECGAVGAGPGWLRGAGACR